MQKERENSLENENNAENNSVNLKEEENKENEEKTLEAEVEENSLGVGEDIDSEDLENDADLADFDNETEESEDIDSKSEANEADDADSKSEAESVEGDDDTEVASKKKRNKSKGENEEGSAEAEKQGKSIFTELWFILTLCAVSFVALLVILISIARAGGLSWKNLFGGDDGNLDYVSDSLDAYINIKESDYKGLEINVPMLPPDEDDLQSEINKLLAMYRGESPKGTYTNVAAQLGYDVNILYLGYQLDSAGRRLLVEGATNYKSANTKTDRYTVGLNSDVFGVGFDNEIIGKMPNGRLDNVTDQGNYVTKDNLIYATVSFVLDNGLVYDEVPVCIDPSADNFESLWGIGAFESALFKSGNSFGSIVLTGNSYLTFPLAGGGQITYTSFTIDYISSASVAPYTVESKFAFDYSIEELRNEKVYYDVYIESVVEYDVPEFNEAFITEKLKLNEDDLASYEGESLMEKCRSHYAQMLKSEYDSVCRSYVEYQVWNKIKANIKITMYPQKEVDRIYIALVEDYSLSLLEENAAGAGYADLDEYMKDVLELGEGGEWTSYLLAQVKDTVKERLIVYAVLRAAGLMPTDEEFARIYEEELKRDYEYAISIYPGAFKDFEDFKTYINDERGEAEYKHTVYYYYATDKLVEMAKINYPSDN